MKYITDSILRGGWREIDSATFKKENMIKSLCGFFSLYESRTASFVIQRQHDKGVANLNTTISAADLIIGKIREFSLMGLCFPTIHQGPSIRLITKCIYQTEL